MASVKTESRNMAADLLRCLAFLFVVCVHFFQKTGFYQQTVYSNKMFVMLVLRALVICCVPMFMTLSGYLLRTKELSKRYFKKIGKIYFSYFLASCACAVFAVVKLGENISFKDFVYGVLEFTAAPYSWYIEMYLGLFFLIPFLNILYNNIPTKKWKLTFVLILAGISFLPAVVNVYSFDSLSWWTSPTSAGEIVEFLPNWWSTVIYPLAYYFLGCYLNEYPIRLNKWVNLFLIGYSVFATGAYNFWRSYGEKFVWGFWTHYYSLFTFIITALVFIFFINRNYEKVPAVLKKGFAKVSALCLNAYLVSSIFDELFYPYLKDHVADVQDRFIYFFLMVPLVALCSLALSDALNLVQEALTILWNESVSGLKKRLLKKKKATDPQEEAEQLPNGE